jgi:hypothetical protein
LLQQTYQQQQQQQQNQQQQQPTANKAIMLAHYLSKLGGQQHSVPSLSLSYTTFDTYDVEDPGLRNDKECGRKFYISRRFEEAQNLRLKGVAGQCANKAESTTVHPHTMKA